MSCTLVLIRHGATAWNREGRYQGHADPPLDLTGRAQARRLARQLAALRLDAVYSSDLKRAVATAVPLASARGLAVQEDPRLRELDFGAWDGRRVEDVIAADPAAWQAWWGDPVAVAPPGGETVRALWGRLAPALAEIIGRHSGGGAAAVVTHGGPLRLILARVTTGRLHPPPAAHVPNGSWLLLTPGAVEVLLGRAPQSQP